MGRAEYPTPNHLLSIIPGNAAPQVSRFTRQSMTGVIQMSDNPAAPAQKSGKKSPILAENRIFPTSLL